MPPDTKPGERTELVMHLGRLLAGLDSLAEQSTPPNSTEYQIAAARFRPDLDRWANDAGRFTTIEGYRFGHELDDILRGLYAIHGQLGTWGRDTAMAPEQKQQYLRDLLFREKVSTLAAIDRVPIAWSARLASEKTPFSTHLHIRDAILAARTRIHYFDRYLRPDFFYLYLRDLPRHIQLRLITTVGNADYGVVAVTSVSRLVGNEFTDYKLLQVSPTDLHDRNLRVDDRIFSLGPSITEAGRYPTNFDPGDSTPSGHQVLDDIIAKSKAVT